MRHVLGVLGVLAAGVLLAVSAAMNWRFGFSLGKTELDGAIYGSASAAADCLKALVPFFLFAAIRNKMWSQAAASAVVWVVVTAYSLTSALGHAALNRLDTAGQRSVEALAYKDMRADLDRAKEQLSWVPQHRPAQMAQSEIDAAKNQRQWGWTNGCTKVEGKYNRGFCDKYHALAAELGAAEQATALEERIASIQARLSTVGHGGTVMTEADPQAAVLAKIGAIFMPGMKVEDVQMALTIFIALLLEVGSGFGMYIAFSQWRLYDRHAPAAPMMVAVGGSTAAAAVAAPQQVAVQISKPRSGANDNKSAPQPEIQPQAEVQQPQVQPLASSQPRLVAPETDVERFYKERIETQDGSSLTATTLYEDYCAWCEEQEKEPLALPTFGREFGELGVQKAKIAGRVRYIGIALKSGAGLEEDKKLPALGSQAA